MGDDVYLIRKDEIAAMAGLSKTHFLNPGARRINKSLGDAAGITTFGFHLIEVAPGDQSTEHHLHHHEDECVFVLEGEAEARIGEEGFTVGPGDFIGYRKGGLAHSIRNTGAGVLRLIVAGARLAHDVCDYPDQGKRIYRNAGLPWGLVDIADVEPLGGGVGKK